MRIPRALPAGALQKALIDKNRKQIRLSVNSTPKPNLWLIGLPRDGKQCWHRQEVVYLNTRVPWPVPKFLQRTAKKIIQPCFFFVQGCSWAAACRKRRRKRSTWDGSLTCEVNHQPEMGKCYQCCGHTPADFINRWMKWASFGPTGHLGSVTVPLITVLM